MKITADRVLSALEKEPELLAEVTERLLERELGVKLPNMSQPRPVGQVGTRRPDGSVLVVCQEWFEHERGWGVRPEGHTLHLTFEARDAFVDGYNKEYNNLPSAPDEYVEGSSTEPFLVAVREDVYDQLVIQQTKEQHVGWRRWGFWAEHNAKLEKLA